MTAKLQILAFDVYGTLLDTGSISSTLRKLLHLGEDKAIQLSLLWRRYQLEYTWRLNSMDHYESFDGITRRSFLHAAAEHHLAVDEDTVDRILEQYSHLSPFADALPALHVLAEQPYIKLMIFSNGTKEMISSVLDGTPLPTILQGVFLADAVKVYKPAKRIYDQLVAHINANIGLNEGTQIEPENVWLVSGNPFDVTGARAAGINAVWVDRPGSGWVDHVTPDSRDWVPTKIVRGLREIADLMRELH